MNPSTPTPREILAATRQLALLARLGYPLAEGLQAMGSSAPWLARVGESMASGDTFAAALQRHPRVFSPFYSAMVAAAEASEEPQHLLGRLSEWLERADSVRRRVRSALLYPLLVLDSLLLEGAVLFGLGMPGLLFALAGAEPGPSAGGLQKLLTSPLPLLAVLAALGVLNLAALHDGPLAAGITARLPWAGPLRTLAEQGLWARALGGLLAAGMPLTRALQTAAGVVRLPELRAEFLAVAERVAAGSPLAAALAEGRRLDPYLAWSAAAGELQEEQATLMLEAAEALEGQVQDRVEHALRMTEPWALLAVGALVALGLASFWWPLYATISGIQP